MPSSLANLFCKTVKCPTSQALLDYYSSFMSPGDQACVGRHLESCDFCSAELQLLARHRSEDEEYSFAEMPPQVRRLAEDLLKCSRAPFHGLAEIAENTRLFH